MHGTKHTFIILLYTVKLFDNAVSQAEMNNLCSKVSLSLVTFKARRRLPSPRDLTKKKTAENIFETSGCEHKG